MQNQNGQQAGNVTSEGCATPSTCVVLRSKGVVERMSDRPLEDYLDFIKGSTAAWIDCFVRSSDMEKDIERIAQTMGFTQTPIQQLMSDFYSSYEDSDTELAIKLPAVTMVEFELTVKPLIVMMRDNFIMTVHPEDIIRLFKFSRYAQQFMKKLDEDTDVDNRTLILERIIDENNDRNFEYLREIEKQGDRISKMLIEETVGKRKLAHDIYTMKHVLIDYLNVLWAAKDVVDSLRYGDADLITDDPKLLGRIGILSDGISRHIGLSEQMSTVLASGLEVMQSIYNNQLQSMNNRFALVTTYMTVLGTAALVPNTLATIAGSGVMDGQMGEQWWYIPLLIVSTVVATLGSYAWVRSLWKSKEPG